MVIFASFFKKNPTNDEAILAKLNDISELTKLDDGILRKYHNAVIDFAKRSLNEPIDHENHSKLLTILKTVSSVNPTAIKIIQAECQKYNTEFLGLQSIVPARAFHSPSLNLR